MSQRSKMLVGTFRKVRKYVRFCSETLRFVPNQVKWQNEPTEYPTEHRSQASAERYR